jgi:hypothetical protein
MIDGAPAQSEQRAFQPIAAWCPEPVLEVNCEKELAD